MATTPTTQIPNGSAEPSVDRQALDLAGSLATVMAKPLDQKIDQAVAEIGEVILISTHEEKARAVALVQTLKYLRDGPTETKDSVAEIFEDIQTSAHRLHKSIVGVRTRLADRITRKIQILSSAVTHFDIAERKREQEAQERATQERELNDRRARVNQLLGAAAEQFKIDRAAVEKRCRGISLDAPTVKDVAQLEGFFRDEQKKAADAKAKRETDEAAAQARAIGDEDLAKQIETGLIQEGAEIPAPLPPPPPAPPAPALSIAMTAPPVKGASLKQKPKLIIEDPKKIPIEYHNPYENLYDPESWPKIKAVVRAMGAQTKIPGVRVEMESETQIRKR